MANLKKWVIVALDEKLDELGRDDDTVLYWTLDGTWSDQISDAILLYNDEKKQWSLPSHGRWLDITRELS